MENNGIKLSERMLEYESKYKTYLDDSKYVIIRLDGKAFHSYTKNFIRPFDIILENTFIDVCLRLMKEIQNCKIIYQQSDEISLVLVKSNENTECYSGGGVQKITSLSASACTVFFNEEIKNYKPNVKSAQFDSRVFTVPDYDEMCNYLIYRLRDCERNSINSYSNAHFSPNQLLNKNIEERLQMLKDKSLDWSKDLRNRSKFGYLIYKDEYGKIKQLKMEEKPNFELLYNTFNIFNETEIK